MLRILLIDDDVELCALLKDYLESETLILDCIYNGKDAFARLLAPDAVRYDLLILDVTLPEWNGFEILKALRKNRQDIPILMLTARGDPADRVAGLEAGADDYVCKPCEPRELAARITAILRRTGGERTGDDEVLRVRDIELDRGSRLVRVGGNSVDLTDVEFRLLDVLLRNAGNAVSLESLSVDVLGREYTPDDRSLNTHVCRLRGKLGPWADGSARIKAPRSKGFVYVCPPQAD